MTDDCEEIEFSDAYRDADKIRAARSVKRWLGYREMKGRGCEFCLHMVRVSYLYLTEVQCEMPQKTELKPKSHMRFCRFKQCPYHELDNLVDYLKEYDSPMAKGGQTIVTLLKSLGLSTQRKPRKPAAPSAGKTNS